MSIVMSFGKVQSRGLHQPERLCTHSFIINTIEAFARLCGLDVFIERTGPEWAFLDFDHEDHGNGTREAWGLDLHVVVSPLKAPHTAA